MQITRRCTAEGKDPFGAFAFVPRTSRIANPDGKVVFEMKDLLAPEPWSQVAVDILAQKYFRKAGVPERHRARAGGGRAGVAASERAGVERSPHGPGDGRAAGVPAAGRLLGLLGLEGRLLFFGGRRPRFLRREPATCWRRRWRRRTRRSGSTPASTGPTASKARRRATTAWTRRRARWKDHKARINILLLTLASSSPSKTTW